MPIVPVGYSRNINSGSSSTTFTLGSGATVAFPTAILPGQTVFAVFGTVSAAIDTITVADNASGNGAVNVYTQNKVFDGTPGGTGNIKLALFSCPVTRTILTSNVITATLSVAITNGAAIGFAVSGMTATPFDNVSAGQTFTTSGSETTAATSTTAQTDELLISPVLFRENSANAARAETGGFFQLAAARSGVVGNAVALYVAWKETEATGAFTDSFTWNTSGVSGGIDYIAAYKCAPVTFRIPSPFQYSGFAT